MKKINRTVLKLAEHMARNEKARMDRFPPSCTGIWHQPKRPIRK
ncbi:MAG: cyclic lactone autoinducer peptide [Lachnospiraceae bacterium]|nr:cyclic lactone autoinducer peptide [Lachnospiraceae bacterium]